MAVKFVSISMDNGKFFARVDSGAKFFVGKRVHFQGMTGLVNLTASASTPIYNSAQHRATHGVWADFIFPTVQCESRGVFHCLNSYDRARFTFGFLQYAAHVPNGDFVKFFRRLLALEAAQSYFPDLKLQNGVIFRETQTGSVSLETEINGQTQRLMDYLNPGGNEVEEIEAINAAKFIHWCDNDLQHQALQVAVGIEHFQQAMKNYANRYALDGRSDKVCLLVADIRHQGRARSSQIISALNTGGDDERAYKNLLEIGKELYASRIATLKREIEKLVAAGVLGTRKYSVAAADFVS